MTRRADPSLRPRQRAVALQALPGRHVPLGPCADGAQTRRRPRQLATELADTATRDCDLEERQAYLTPADDGDHVGDSELAEATGGECRVIHVFGGVDAPDPRGRVLDPGEPSQPAPSVRWPADAPVVGDVKWAARTFL